ncbi:MAG: hypothetical protein BWY95_01607 [Bacteroidetes bacterium ADurb.BinA104]|nr:MAG: hypothetical protein BWY95_01607 [Bacteroidetes bacterium ADurb.BinA104]
MCRKGVAAIGRNAAFVSSFHTCGIGLAVGAEVLRNLISGIGSETYLYIVEINIVTEEVFAALSHSNHSNIIYIPVIDVITILAISSKADFEGREGVGVNVFGF